MQSIDYEFTDKDISPWGGLRLVQGLYVKSGLRQMIESLPLPEAGSNRGYSSVDIIEGFMVSVILGAKRFTHSGNIRNDEVVREIFQWKKGMASQSTFTRFFKRFTLDENDHLMTELNKQWFKKIYLDKHTIDFDSTVISRYGVQEGVKVGYNPKKNGRGSHHPILAFAAEAKMVVQAWMRQGNDTSATNFPMFISKLLEIIPSQKIGLIRADSGFSGKTALEALEENRLNYIIGYKSTSSIVDRIFHATNWQRIDNGISCCSFMHQASSWDRPRRIVVVRKNSNLLYSPAGKTLFPDYDTFAKYRYSIFVTNLPLNAELIWELYKKRADAENRIKELKYDYGAEGFCSESFAATEAAFRWVMIAHNLMSLFRQKILNTNSGQTLSTTRFQCIALGSYLVKKGRSVVLKISATEKKRDFIESLFVNLDSIAFKT